MRIFILSISFSLLTLAAFAQVKVQMVAPQATQEGLKTVHSPHIALQPPAGTDQHRLLIMIGGTGSVATSFRTFDSCFAAMGYHVISPDYLNNVITTVCSKSEDSACFDHFRQEIMFGTPVSDKVAVDSANSLVHRVSALLVYLAKNDPAGGWQQFLKKGQPRWDRIIAAGHSQGAGHAAYFGKKFRMRGVFMFSGPQDYLQYFNSPAHWQGESSRTPASRYYAFLHAQDPFNYSYQAQNVSLINHHPVTDTTMVQPGVPVHSQYHVLVTDINKKDKHSATISPEFIEVWKYMVSGIAGR